MPGRELISKRTRNAFREALSGWYTLRTIEIAFDNEGFAPDRTHEPTVDGQRRSFVEQYYHAIDFADSKQVMRLLRAYGRIISEISDNKPDVSAKLRVCLESDGYRFENGVILSKNLHTQFHDLAAIAQTIDARELLIQIERIEGAIATDPALAIGTAKELVESCCKTILAERGVAIDRNADLPQLIRATMRELKLLPDDIPDSARGAETMKRMLSNLGSVVSGLAEMRNLYGSGHGRDGRAKGLSDRHAKLAAGAAGTLAVFLFETHQARPQTKLEARLTS